MAPAKVQRTSVLPKPPRGLIGQRLNSKEMRIMLHRRQFVRTAAGGALSGLGGVLIPPLVGLRVTLGADVARWVAERGGIVQTDASSRITGVNLGFSLHLAGIR